MVVMEVEAVVVEDVSSVELVVVAVVVAVTVVGDLAETTKKSVSVTVAVESAAGVAVTVSVIVVGDDVTVSTTVVAASVELPPLPPPLMATTEYVSRGRRAWNLPTRRSCSATGRHAEGS